MGDTVALNVNVFLRNLVMLFGSLVFMFKLSWRLTTMNFIALPLIAVISKLYGDYYEVKSSFKISVLPLSRIVSCYLQHFGIRIRVILR